MLHDLLVNGVVHKIINIIYASTYNKRSDHHQYHFKYINASAAVIIHAGIMIAMMLYLDAKYSLYYYVSATVLYSFILISIVTWMDFATLPFTPSKFPWIKSLEIPGFYSPLEEWERQLSMLLQR